MTNDPQLYCSAPWNGITIMEDGAVRTCCEGKSVIADLRTDSVDTIDNSPTLARIRQRMQAGRPDPSNCISCMLKEKKDGIAPLRQYYQTYFPKINNQLKFIDIRWNNTCNLGCIYCSPMFSSVWEDRLNQKHTTPVKQYQDDLLEWILERIDHVDEIMLVGGEPMLTKQNYTLIKHIPATCRLSIVTNLSYDLESLPCIDALLDRDPQYLTWNISAENTRSAYEYIRSGSSWQQFEKNLKFLQAHCPGTQRLAMVYFLLSAFDLNKTITQCYEQYGITKFVLQPLVGNQALDINCMPDVIRDQALEILQSTISQYQSIIQPDKGESIWLKYADKIQQHLSMSSARKIITLEDFQKHIQWTDQWGPRRFQDVWPDLNQTLIKNLS